MDLKRASYKIRVGWFVVFVILCKAVRRRLKSSTFEKMQGASSCFQIFPCVKPCRIIEMVSSCK